MQTQLNSPQNEQSIKSHLGLLDNDKSFDFIRENQELARNALQPISIPNNALPPKPKSNDEIASLKAVLSSLLSKVNDLERRDTPFTTNTAKGRFSK